MAAFDLSVVDAEDSCRSGPDGKDLVAAEEGAIESMPTQLLQSRAVLSVDAQSDSGHHDPVEQLPN